MKTLRRTKVEGVADGGNRVSSRAAVDRNPVPAVVCDHARDDLPVQHHVVCSADRGEVPAARGARLLLSRGREEAAAPRMHGRRARLRC
jgi:hypothetical protein